MVHGAVKGPFFTRHLPDECMRYCIYQSYKMKVTTFYSQPMMIIKGAFFVFKGYFKILLYYSFFGA